MSEIHAFRAGASPAAMRKDKILATSVQPSPLRSDRHAAFSQHTEHSRFADSHALSHIKA
jgi:hypothetical protein